MHPLSFTGFSICVLWFKSRQWIRLWKPHMPGYITWIRFGWVMVGIFYAMPHNPFRPIKPNLRVATHCLNEVFHDCILHSMGFWEGHLGGPGMLKTYALNHNQSMHATHICWFSLYVCIQIKILWRNNGPVGRSSVCELLHTTDHPTDRPWLLINQVTASANLWQLVECFDGNIQRLNAREL